MLRFVRDARARRARRVPLPQPRAGRSLADTQGECTAPALWTGARDTPSMRPMPPSGPSPDSASGRAAERRRWTRPREGRAVSGVCLALAHAWNVRPGLVRALSLDGTCLRHKCEEDKALGYELTKRFAALIIARLEATRLQLLDVYGQSR